MDPMLGLIALQALRSQDEIRRSIENQGSKNSVAWGGWLSPELQKHCMEEAILKDNTRFYLYPVEVGREQEDIVLQRERLFIAGGKSSWLPNSRSYFVLAVVAGCPSCGCEMNFGLYRRCGQCRASLSYVMQCLKCNHLHVGVDVRVFGREFKCEGCGTQLRNATEPNSPVSSEPKRKCAECGTEILASTAFKYGGKCARCSKQ